MLRIVEHPLARHLLSRLRDRTTPPEDFRRLASRLTQLIVLEATRDLGLVDETVETPLESMVGQRLSERLVVVPILRAGLSMVEPVVSLIPDVLVGHLGLERDETAGAAPRAYYRKFPALAGRRVLVLDPMLATGGSACMALSFLRSAGAKDGMKLACMVSAPAGIERVRREFPSVEVVTASVDRELDSRAYILPGLGDFGDRLYGTGLMT